MARQVSCQAGSASAKQRQANGRARAATNRATREGQAARPTHAPSATPTGAANPATVQSSSPAELQAPQRIPAATNPSTTAHQRA